MIDLFKGFYKRLTADGSTEDQAIQSGIWVAGINVGDRVLQLLKVVILARLLSPEAFGLLGIALLAIAALQQFSKLGFDEALIQHEDKDINAYLNTAWVMKTIRGLLIAVVAFLIAPHLSMFFGEPQAAPLIRIIAVSPLILGLQNPAVVYFQKDLNFHREFIYMVGGRLVDLTVAVVIALAFQSVWALAAGIVAMNLVKFTLSYIIHEYRPSIEFNLDYGREMFGYGKWVFAFAILMFLYGQGDDVFVGWFFGATTLGFYQIAYRFSNAPATEVTDVITRVAFPALSKVQNDTERLRKGYLQTLQLSTFIGFPVAAGIIAVAPQFVPIVFGSQWKPTIPLIQTLALWGAMRCFGANDGAVFKAIGRPDYDVKLGAIKVLIIILLILPAANLFGALGVAFVIVANEMFLEPISLYLVSTITGISFQELFLVTIYPLIGSVWMGVVVMGADHYLFSGTGIIELVFLIVAGIGFYFGYMLMAEKFTSYDISALYLKMKKSI